MKPERWEINAASLVENKARVRSPGVCNLLIKPLMCHVASSFWLCSPPLWLPCFFGSLYLASYLCSLLLVILDLGFIGLLILPFLTGLICHNDSSDFDPCLPQLPVSFFYHSYFVHYFINTSLVPVFSCTCWQTWLLRHDLDWFG